MGTPAQTTTRVHTGTGRNKGNVAARFKETEGDPEATDEAAVLNAWLKQSGEEADLKKRLKEAEADLDAKAYAHSSKLTEAEIKTLVVDDKWLAALVSAIHGEMVRVSQQLAVHAVAEATLQRPHGLLAALALGLAAQVVRPPRRVVAHLGHGHHVQRPVDLAVSSAGQPVADVVAGGRIDGRGAGPGREVPLGRKPGNVADLD